MQRRPLKITIIGDQTVDGRSLRQLLAYSMEPGYAIDPVVCTPYNTSYRLEINDTDKNSVFEANAVLIAYRVDDRASFEKATQRLQRLRHCEKERKLDKPIHVCLVGLDYHLNSERQVPFNVARCYKSSSDSITPHDEFFEVSLVTREGAKEMISSLIDAAIEHLKMSMPKRGIALMIEKVKESPRRKQVVLALTGGTVIVGVGAFYSASTAFVGTLIVAAGAGTYYAYRAYRGHVIRMRKEAIMHGLQPPQGAGHVDAVSSYAGMSIALSAEGANRDEIVIFREGSPARTEDTVNTEDDEERKRFSLEFDSYGVDDQTLTFLAESSQCSSLPHQAADSYHGGLATIFPPIYYQGSYNPLPASEERPRGP